MGTKPILTDSQFVKIPTKFIEELYKSKLANETKILLYLIRKTLGWNKASDKISYSQFQKDLNISRKEISRCLKELEFKGVIVRDSYQYVTSYRLVTSYQSVTKVVTDRLPKVVTNRLHTIDNIKDNIKDIYTPEVKTSDDRNISLPNSPSNNNLITELQLDNSETLFNTFWNAYPRKIGKPDALKKFKVFYKKDKDVLSKLMIALDKYKNIIKQDKTEERYIKHGSTFMNNWEDYYNLKDKPKQIARELKMEDFI